jgi:hypothetical protein
VSPRNEITCIRQSPSPLSPPSSSLIFDFEKLKAPLLRNYKVLVIEDSKISAQIMTVILGRYKYEVTHAKNGKITLKIIDLSHDIFLLIIVGIPLISSSFLFLLNSP